MISSAQALAVIPSGLRDPLLAEHRLIVQHYMERKWRPAELSGGHFCEIVYTILDGYGTGNFAASPNKPPNFVDACKRLENYSKSPRSFQILIPRLLPALYEVRNNRGVGHVSGDVDSNQMDSVLVLGIASWVMAELIRVFHQLKVDEAQQVVNQLVERRIPTVWQVGDVRRVLDTSLKLSDQVLLLIASAPTQIATDDLYKWTGYDNRAYFNRSLRELHNSRFVELSDDEKLIEILPPGAKHVDETLMPKYV